MRRIFEDDYDIQRIIRMINIETGERIHTGRNADHF